MDEKRFILEDGFSLTPGMLLEGLEHFRASFPDVQFTYTSIKEEREGKVVIDGFKCKGTHTGQAYAPAPGLPAIEAKGTVCENDEERVLLEMCEGKILFCQVVALGSYTGFLGFYEQIGGSV